MNEPLPKIVHQQLIGPWSRVADAAAEALEALACVLPARLIPRVHGALPQAIAEYVAVIKTVRRKGLTQHLPADVAGRVFVVIFVIDRRTSH